MSASLVGSEMCIRDSASRWAASIGRASSCAPQLALACSLAAHRALAAAVSYTHLTLPTICSV
eukprot:7810415-Alexandrium_andersonii.AAC.1